MVVPRPPLIRFFYETATGARCQSPWYPADRYDWQLCNRKGEFGWKILYAIRWTGYLPGKEPK